MLLRRDERGVLGIAQSSHAWISGQLARAWGNDRFPGPDPWEEACLAAEQHDIGMSEWDLEPERDPGSGLPYSFMEMDLQTHVGLWTAAPRKLLAQSRYAALLVSMHGWRLYERRNLGEVPTPDAQLIRDYLAAQEAFQQDMRASLQAPAEQVAHNSQLIWIWDSMSLALCLDWAPRTIREVPSLQGPVDLELVPLGGTRRLALDPWPFASEQISVRCEGRRLGGRYESDDALHRALATASWETVEFELFSR